MRLEYSRLVGKKQTYSIGADARGCYEIWHGTTLLLSGKDRLTACGGRTGRPNRRKELGAIEAAKRMIERAGFAED